MSGYFWGALEESGGLDLSAFSDVVTTLGPVAGWLMLGWAVFRYLMGHAANLQRDNIKQLIEQRDEWKARAIAAEKAVAAYASTYGPPPEGALSLPLVLEEILQAVRDTENERSEGDGRA